MDKQAFPQYDRQVDRQDDRQDGRFDDKFDAKNEGRNDDGAPTPLTPKEKVVLEFLEGYARLNGMAPTYQEICSHFGFASFNSAQRYLKQLEAKHYIALGGGNQKRAIRLLRSSSAYQEVVEERERAAVPMASSGEPAPEAVQLPLLGRVAAGAPLEAYENDEFIDVPASLVKSPDRTFALRVRGRSMIDDGILDGDVILVQRQSQAHNGEIVVAVVESDRGQEEATVKRFYIHKSDDRQQRPKVELRPANSEMTSIWCDPRAVQIRGVVVGLIRKFW